MILSDLEKIATTIKEKVRNIDGVEKVTTNQDEKKTVYSLIVDPSKGNTEQIAQQLGVMLNKTPIGTITLNEKQKPVFLEPLTEYGNTRRLEKYTIMTERVLYQFRRSPHYKVRNVQPASSIRTEKPTFESLHPLILLSYRKFRVLINVEIFGDQKGQ